MESSHTDIGCMAIQKINEKSAELKQLNQEIWSHPELCYKEYHAHKILTDYLQNEGFKVERNFIHETGFRATFGDGGLVNVCLVCEYDALPEIGHACGHNLIAECGVAAGLGVKAEMEKNRNFYADGKVTILGTPAEEGGGGKLAMIEAKVFDDVDVAMMAHPCPHNLLRPILLAKYEVHVCFNGKAAHAAAFPWEGKNALDAAVMCYQNISVMRQQMKPDWRVHGIFTNGGVKPNIIPEKAELLYYLRAPTRPDIDELKSRFEGCVQGAACATGCQVSLKYTSYYQNLVNNHHLASIYEKHATNLGLEFNTDETVLKNEVASGDIGNVSQTVPAIQPGYSIHPEASNHTRQFRDAAGSDTAHIATLTQAKILALTALDLLKTRDNRDHILSIKKEFNQTFARRK